MTGAAGLPEASVTELRARMDDGQESAQSITAACLERIEARDRRGPVLGSVIETNPDALDIAAALDRERASGHVRGPLHGIPVLVKDNVDTGDRMLTTAGSFALADAPAPADAPLVVRLRAAGCVVLGKANMTEWANFRSTSAVSGWSARGGQCRNPYVLDRSPIGSSSGSAVAVAGGLVPLAVGTETDGSIVLPAAAGGLVGIKPTIGLISRTGVIPIAASQDTAGPMAGTVTDATLLLEAMIGRDPDDPATAGIPDALRPGGGRRPLAADLVPGGLSGARIGVLRHDAFADVHARVVFEDALGALRGLGAALIDPLAIPGLVAIREPELTVLHHEFKAGLARYLDRRRGSVAVRSLADVIAFNERDRERELALFGQERMLLADATEGLGAPAYRAARAEALRLARTEGIDALLAGHRLDALVAPTAGLPGLIDPVLGDRDITGSSTPAAVAGYPSITVPVGQAFGLPVGISFIGPAWSERALIRYAFDIEQATQARRPPRFLPSIEV